MSNLNNNTAQLEALLAKVNALPEAGGTDTSDATASASDILSGKTAYVDGEKITGNIATVTQATPTVTINTANGLITATATQTAGYVAAGSKSGTKQLAFKAATTITPGTTNQTAVAANTYVGGAITVKGDSNLVASNIVSGKSIFGVVGTATAGGGSGGDTSVEDAFVTRTLTTYTNDRVTSIGSYAFYKCSRLTSVSFPAVITINSYAFLSCTILRTVSLPLAAYIYSYAFSGCSKLATISLPSAISIGGNAFWRCTSFSSIYIGTSRVCWLGSSNAFLLTDITSSTGSIFVPASLVSAYKSATNWAFFSARIFSYNFT